MPISELVATPSKEVVIYSYPNRIEELRKFIRVCDVIIALVGLFFCSIFFIFLFLLIKITSRGSFFYKQVRIGEHGREFIMYKIRTMHVDAEKNGPQVSGPHDTRCTIVGKWLRRTRLDETPQFFNVLKGDMSVVGPRPERPERLEGLQIRIPDYISRLSVPQGITGWAQIHCGYGSSFEIEEEKFKFDVEYINNFSFFRYLFILLFTPIIMIGRRGM